MFVHTWYIHVDGCTDGCTTLLDFAQVQEAIV